MSGVSNLRPPQPKYSFTWDVEVVLNLFKSWPENLEPKRQTFKTVTLLGLIAIPRGAELHLLDLNYLEKFHNFYRFKVVGLVKNRKKGVTPNCVEFHEHTENLKICPLDSLRRYLQLTGQWRVNGKPSTLFLTFKSPHDPVSTSRLAGWIKETLHLAGVDTNVFQAHSLRGAASSKAFLKGLSSAEVVQQGSWSREYTWQRFYHKQVVLPSKKFQDRVLQL